MKAQSVDLEQKLKNTSEIARLTKSELDKSILQLPNLEKELAAKKRENERVTKSHSKNKKE